MKHLIRVFIIVIVTLVATSAWAGKPVFQQVLDKAKQATAAKTIKPTPSPTTPAVTKPKAAVVMRPVFVGLKELARNKK